MVEGGSIIFKGFTHFYSFYSSIFNQSYCQAQPESQLSWAEISYKIAKTTNNNKNNNRGSIKQTEFDSFCQFNLMNTVLVQHKTFLATPLP